MPWGIRTLTHGTWRTELPTHSVSPLITLKDFRGQDVRFVGKSKGGYSIAIGYSLTETESAIRSIVISSNIMLPVIVLFAFAGGLLLVGRLLRPINEVNRYLAAAATHPLTRDLPHLDVGKKDEIGELSRRVTETVGKMRTSMRYPSYSSLVPRSASDPAGDHAKPAGECDAGAGYTYSVPGGYRINL